MYERFWACRVPKVSPYKDDLFHSVSDLLNPLQMSGV